MFLRVSSFHWFTYNVGLVAWLGVLAFDLSAFPPCPALHGPSLVGLAPWSFHCPICQAFLAVFGAYVAVNNWGEKKRATHI